ncbi:MAG: glycosyltransferase [Lachnospiraceae bacterium]|nr:glycosyltransferase [Lachnospiraceae bacterium]
MKEYGVVVLNYMNFALTEKCVDNILQKETDVFVVIVDNASPNESYDELRQHYKNSKDVLTIRNEANNGYSAGNNCGFRKIKEVHPEIDYYCVLNPDAEITENNTFKALKRVLETHEDIAVCAPTMLLNHKYIPCETGYGVLPKVKDIYKRHFLLYRGNDNRIKDFALDVLDDNIAYVDFVIGACFMIKRVALESIGYMDEGTFMYNEEAILSIHLTKIGYKEAVLLDLLYSHNHQRSAPRRDVHAKLHAEKRGYISRKYLCENYYDGQGLLRLKIAHMLNVFYLVLAATYHKFKHD